MKTTNDNKCPSKKCNCIDCQTDRAEACYNSKGGHHIIGGTCIKCEVTFS